MLAEFRDYLKSLNVAENYYIGKIEQSKPKTVGVYSTPNLKRVEAIGKDSSYDVAGIRILIHWNRNAKETEAKAREIYQLLRYVRSVTMGTKTVDYLDLDDGEPVFLGTDDQGIYEYHIAGRLYYRR